MLNHIRCINFRKHADLTVHFTPGINTIRAANEAGKSTLLEAIAYAYFGTAGLKETIDDVVTYDTPTNQLRVEHSFTLSGVTYEITRSPKGAELTAPGITVTGQKEVTKFVENLFGASQDMAANLMMARQKDLGGALKQGPTAAGKMIEDLADLDLIDEIINLIGEKLLAGNTSAQQATVDMLRTQADVEMVPEPLAARQAETIAKNAVLVATTVHLDLKGQLDELDVDAARAIVADEARLQATIAARTVQMKVLEDKHAVALPVAPAEAEINALRAQLVAEQDRTAALKLKKQLEGLNVEALWEGDVASLEAAIKMEGDSIAVMETALEAACNDHTAEVAKLARIEADGRLQVAEIEGKLIKEESCTFCGKDLKDIPEVALINNPLFAKLKKVKAGTEKAKTDSQIRIIDLDSKRLLAVEALTGHRDNLRQMRDVLATTGATEPLYARAEAYITLDRTSVPSTWTWKGPLTDEATDTAARLAQFERETTIAVAAAATREAEQIQLTGLRSIQNLDLVALNALELVDAQETLAEVEALKPKVATAFDLLQQAQAAAVRASAELHSLEVTRQLLAQSLEAAKASLTKALADLTEMEANNALVKKLRAARPVITDKLWAIVLAAVTTYSSDVRGEKSVITRLDGKFKCNGKPVSGLSGSAEDVLGLSVRFALTKTFLPGIDFVILDEVAAACDDAREIAMLGLLATSGFAQTILVTHSPLADAFSDNIITI